MPKRLRKAGRSLTRSEVITVRLDSKLRYVAELAARKQRRTLSSFIEWAVEHGLLDVQLSSNENAKSAWNDADSLWDVDEADRFVKLALKYPDLLTHDEQILWKLIRDSGMFWRGHHDVSTGEWTWRPTENFVLFDRIRQNWAALQAVARGEEKADANTFQIPSKEVPNDDIPF